MNSRAVYLRKDTLAKACGACGEMRVLIDKYDWRVALLDGGVSDGGVSDGGVQERRELVEVLQRECTRVQLSVAVTAIVSRDLAGIAGG